MYLELRSSGGNDWQPQAHGFRHEPQAASCCTIWAMTGLFLAFEGLDGCGKSTQLARVADYARSRGLEPLLVREPGGTVLGEQLRDVLLDPRTGDIAGTAEALLYAASRAELVATRIRPALLAGGLVLADRFVGSSLAYQGAGRELGIDQVRRANELAIGDAMPDINVLVRVAVGVAAARRSATDGEADRIELAGDSFFTRVARAYDEIAAADPAGWLVIEGDATPDEVFGALIAHIGPRIDQLVPEVTVT